MQERGRRLVPALRRLPGAEEQGGGEQRPVARALDRLLRGGAGAGGVAGSRQALRLEIERVLGDRGSGGSGLAEGSRAASAQSAAWYDATARTSRSRDSGDRRVGGVPAAAGAGPSHARAIRSAAATLRHMLTV